METVPVFPLHTVLFPQAPLRLNIFEERYRQMINDCMAEERCFGVVLIREGGETGPPAVPHDVGTIARILAVKRLPEGRMNILTEGQERFRLLDYAPDAAPYLLGVTEPLRDLPYGDHVPSLVQEVNCLFQTYFQLLVSQVGIEMPGYEMPDDPEQFSFVISAAVRGDAHQKQALLEMTDTGGRLEVQRDLLERETARIRRMAGVRVRPAERIEASRGRPFFSSN